MCGICGQYNFGSSEPVRRSDIEAMTNAMVHRGPDDEGHYIAGPLGLGFRRLSIIDLAGGHQPMSDEQESVWVVFNGEIYNFLELREELQSHGHVFRTKCDTEVIVHGYKQWGDEVLNRLNGMFGLAIWDTRPSSSGSGARSVRNQAAVLPDRPRPAVLRIGDASGSRHHEREREP